MGMVDEGRWTTPTTGGRTKPMPRPKPDPVPEDTGDKK